MAVEIPVYVDIFEPLKNAAKDVPQAAKPLESQMDALSERMSKSILKMGKAAAKSASGVDIGDIDQKMARYANSARLAAQRMAELGEAQGVLKAGSVNIASLSAQVTNLANKWNAMRLNSKFDENGKIRNRAQDIIDKLTTAAEKAIKFGDALNRGAENGAEPLKLQINLLKQYEQYMDRLKQGRKIVDELNQSLKGMMSNKEATMFAPFDPQKMDRVLTALAHAQVQLNKPVNIEPYVEGLSRADFELLQMREHYRALEESSRRLSTSINGYRERIAELNEQWNRLTAEEKFTPGGKLTSEAQQLYDTFKRETEELRKQGQTLDQMLQKEERLTEAKKRGIQTRRYENAILNTNVKTMRVLQEQERILSDRLSRAQIGSGKYKQLQKDLEAVRMEIERVNGRVSSTVPELGKVDNKLANLIKRSVQLLALHSATTFIRNIREVTSEFEMQRVALGGIIQDTEKANALFKEIKAAAVRSPFEIKDLVTYTKQLSAYRVETEDLFRVTMQLADVSAGLGVDMNRLILAYGQVKSASVLRGQELRQFTEAGIPLVKLLADKFVELGRAGTTTADVFELISKRAVPFEMIAEIFDDMTQRGGMFYKMQEKQSETLLGQWNNLKDSLSIMYDEIGNTEIVHGAMASLMNDAKFLFQNWRLISEAVKAAVVQYGAMKIASMWMPNLRRELSLAKKAQDALTRSTELSKYAMEAGSKSALREAARLKTYSALIKQASLETRLFHRAWLMLKAVMSGGGWIGLAVGAVTALSSALFSAYKESSRLTNELKKIGTEGETNINRSVSNFNRLAHAAVSAADGSKEQTAAVAELKRTYGDIIPVQQLEANALRELQGNYESLTRAIREKISEQIREQKVSTIVDEYGKKITKRQGKASNYLGAYGLDKEQIRAVMDALQEAVEDGLINAESTVFERSELFKKTIYDLTGVIVDFGNGFRDLSGKWRDVRDLDKAENALNDLLDVYFGLNKQIKDVDDSMSGSIGTYGKFAKMSKDMAESLSSLKIDTSTFGKKGTFKYNQENIRQRVEVYWNYIQKAFEEVNRERAQKIDISSALLGDGRIDFDFIDKAVDEAMAGGKNTRLNTFIESIQEGYEKLIPSDRIVNLVRAKVAEFANAFNVPMDTAQQYYKKADDSMEDYVKSLQESEKSLNSSVNQMELNNKEIENGTEILMAYSQAEIDAAKNTHLFVQALIEYLSQFKKKQDKEKKEAYVQDPFIKQIQERMKFMKDFQSGYEKLQKYMSSSAALGKESQIMLTRGMSIGIDPTEQKRAAEDLSKWYEDTYNAAFDYLKKNKGVTGTMQEFLSKQIAGNTNRDKMLKDFQSLIQSLFDAKTDFDTAQTAKNIEESLARVKDEIKRSETARNFYQDILGLTGDEELATSLSVSVYGGVGQDFKDRLQSQLNEAFMNLDWQNDEMADWDSPLAKAIEDTDWNVIMENLDRFPEEWRKRLKEMKEADEKFNADYLKDLYKTYEKAKTFDQRRQDIRNREAQKRTEIEANKSLSKDEKTKLTNASINKEAKDIAKVNVEELKNTYAWGKAFEDLDRVGSKTLVSLRQKIEDIIEVQKDSLDPADYKALVDMLNKIKDTQIQREPVGSFAGAARRTALIAPTVFSKQGTKGYDKAIAKIKEFNEKAKETEKIDIDHLQDEFMNSTDAVKKGANAVADYMSQWKGVIDTISDVFDLDEIPILGETVDGISSALGVVAAIIPIITVETVALSAAANSIPFVAILSAIVATLGAIIGMIKGIINSKVEQLNKKIEAQKAYVDELERSYSRLEKAMEKSFGTDYVENYTKAMENLNAQRKAYEEQARLEREKGKKSDAEKVKDYEDAAKDAAEKIEEKENQLSEFFSGTDLTAAAKDFASAWLDAYKEFGSVTTAMKEKFQEMLDEMVENAMFAHIAQAILEPFFKEINDRAEDGELSARDVAEIASMVPNYVSQLNDSFTVAANQLQSYGHNLRQQVGSFTGISRSIAGASEESITGLAAGINTQNFYMQHIDMNVALILSAMTGGTTTAGASVTGEVVDPYKDQMLLYAGHLPAMDQNLAELLAEVRKVIKPRGTTATHYVATNL